MQQSSCVFMVGGRGALKGTHRLSRVVARHGDGGHVGALDVAGQGALTPGGPAGGRRGLQAGALQVQTVGWAWHAPTCQEASRSSVDRERGWEGAQSAEGRPAGHGEDFTPRRWEAPPEGLGGGGGLSSDIQAGMVVLLC